jgi:glycine/D-amino acid oxidase-like deaminating enzyme
MVDLNRRRLLHGSAILGGMHLSGCATGGDQATPGSAAMPTLAPVRAQIDRLFKITVCAQPFRAAGPRIEAEQVGDALVVHNYGHGGSGWSLSWGSSAIAVQKAMAGSPREVAVVGCGALGLTSATLAQRAGARVTIYARELLPETRSAHATGRWSPDALIAQNSGTASNFAATWERMARFSFQTHRQYLGSPGDPVAWTDYYTLRNTLADYSAAASGLFSGAGSIEDLTPPPIIIPRGQSPFPAAYTWRSRLMMFNIADYGRRLMADFTARGGEIQRVEFHAPGELAGLKEKVVINCPGYGARALWRDASVTPVRCQLGWLIAQPEVTYGVISPDVSMLSRHDGIVFRAISGSAVKPLNDDSETPDRDETVRALNAVAGLSAQLRQPATRASISPGPRRIVMSDRG